MARGGKAGVWADVLTVVSIVAVGVCVAAVIERGAPTESESRAEIPTTSTAQAPTSAPAEPVDTTYRTPEVTFPTTVPGCDVVEPPTEESSTWARVVTSEDTYDKPQASWYSGPRSVMMSNAVAETLPDRVDVLFGSARESLVFQPIPESGREPGQPVEPEWATASAEVGRGDAIGTLSVSVAQQAGVPPCVAGAVQERTTEANGTVVDAAESWSEFGGVRTDYRSVTAYTPDGSRVAVTASNARGFQSTNDGERDIVLTITELKAIALLGQLQTTAPVPAGTPPPRTGCDDTYGFATGGTVIDSGIAAGLDAALERVDVGERFDPELNTLKLADFSTDVVCTHVDVVDTGADLSVSIRGGQELPVAPDVYDPAYASRPNRFEVLEDGAVLQLDDAPYSYSPATAGGASGGLRRTVTVTYPSGTEVQVRSVAQLPDEPLGADKLRTIATADGLDAL